MSLPPPGTTVRDARPDDIGRIAELLAGGALTVREQPERPEEYRRALEEIAATPGSDVLVAELDGEVVAMCQLITFRHLQHHGGRCAEIESLHVDARHRGAGIGSELLAAAVARAREAGCYRVQLTSNLGRPDARRFYERHRFGATHVGFKRYLE
ncbi:MAG: GNAT family N-acetyltransferase [Acidimicrobiales bacterium]